jgi:ATP-dependent DNA ligase
MQKSLEKGASSKRAPSKHVSSFARGVHHLALCISCCAVSDFDCCAGRKGSRDAFLYAFDLLELDGRDLRSSPWEDRRRALTKLLHKAGDGIRLSEHLATTDGNTLFRHACAMGLEGIVAKRRDRAYRSGRSPNWIKIKNLDARGSA